MRGKRIASKGFVSALLMSSALVTIGVVLPAIVDKASAQSGAGQGKPFNIRPQSLQNALTIFGQQAGIQVSVDAAAVRGLSSPGVTGSMPPQAAIGSLLAGTGLNYRFTSPSTVLISRASAVGGGEVAADGSTMLQEIVIQGQGNPNSIIGNLPEEHAGGQVARGAQVGMLGNRSTMNTPFSQTAYTRKKIEDQQAENLQDVLSNDPSVLTNNNRGGSSYESTSIRGFSGTTLQNSGSLNGLAGMAPLNSADMDFIERVDVLRGPTALLNGMTASGVGGIGGTVNLQTKQATDQPLTALTTRYTSKSQVGAHVDFGRRFGAEKQFGLRFNGAFRKGDTSVDPQSTEIGSVALNLDYRGERVRISADIAHQSNEASPVNMQYLTISSVGVVPDAPDAGTSLNPSWSEGRTRSTMAMLRGEVDLSDNVTAYAAVGKQRYDLSFKTPLQPTLLNTDGDYRWVGLYNQRQSIDVLSMQGGLRATASTGPVDHQISLNLSQSRMKQGAATWSGVYACQTNIYNPVHCSAPIFGDVNDPSWSIEHRMSSVGFADTMSAFDERIQFTAGLRYQKVERTLLPTGATAYSSDAWTPAFALVVKPAENVSVYANYIQALQAGQIVGASFDNAGEVLPPFLGEQYEAGVKVDWGAVTTTLAIFQITQASTISIPNPGGLPTLAANGEQRNRGIEFNAYGEVTDGIRLLGGVTFLDARLSKTQNGLYDGNWAQGAPKFRAVIGAEWDTPFMEGLTLTGRFNYTGNQVVSNTNENLKIPSYATLDLGARYTFDSPWNDAPVTIRFNVDNVLNKNYWSMASNNTLYLGTPRTFRLSAAFNF